MILLTAQTFLSRYRRTTLLCTGLVALLLIVLASGLELKEDVNDLLPQGDREVTGYRTLLSRFNQLDRMLVAIGPIGEDGSASFDDAQTTAQSLGRSMEASGLFTDVKYKVGPESMGGAQAALRACRADLFTEADRKELEARLTPKELTGLLTTWRRTLLETPAPYLARQFREDPLGLDGFWLKKIEPLRALGGGVTVRHGSMISPEGGWLLLTASPKARGTDSLGAAAVTAFMEEAIRALPPSAGGGRLRVAWLSGHRFSAENAARIKRDIRLVGALSAAAILLLCLLSFRRWTFFLLTFAPALFGGLLAAGVVGFFHPEVSAIVAGFGGMLIGVLVDYGIQYLYQADRGAPPAEALTRLGRPMAYSAVTSMAVFLVLFLSRFNGYRQLGWFTFVGILGAVSFSLFILPLMAGTPVANKRPPWDPTPAFGRFFPWARRRRVMLLCVAVALTLVSIPGLMSLRFGGDMQAMNAASKETWADFDLMTQTFRGALTGGSAVVHAETLDGALEKATELDAALVEAQRRGEVAAHFSITTLLPPRAVAEANRHRWREFWSPARLKRVGIDLEAAARPLGYRADVFAPALKVLGLDGEPASPETFASPLLREAWEGAVSVEGGDAAVLVSFIPAAGADFSALKASLEKAVPGAYAGNGMSFALHVAKLMKSETLKLGLLAVLLNALLFWVFTGNLRDMALILAPMVLAALWTFGLAGLTGRPATVLDGLVVVFILGLVSDYAIFLLAAGKQEESERGDFLASVGSAVLVSFLTTAAGLGSLVVATHPALRAVGINATVGLLAGLFAVLLLLPWSWKEKPPAPADRTGEV